MNVILTSWIIVTFLLHLVTNRFYQCYIFLSTGIFRQHSCLFPLIFSYNPQFFTTFLLFWWIRSIFIPTFSFPNDPFWNHFRVFFPSFYFSVISHSALFLIVFRKYFLRKCNSSFSIFQHALQTFSTFDAFSNFLLTFHFYMIFLSICDIIL